MVCQFVAWSVHGLDSWWCCEFVKMTSVEVFFKHSANLPVGKSLSPWLDWLNWFVREMYVKKIFNWYFKFTKAIGAEDNGFIRRLPCTAYYSSQTICQQTNKRSFSLLTGHFSDWTSFGLLDYFLTSQFTKWKGLKIRFRAITSSNASIVIIGLNTSAKWPVHKFSSMQIDLRWISLFVNRLVTFWLTSCLLLRNVLRKLFVHGRCRWLHMAVIFTFLLEWN